MNKYSGLILLTGLFIFSIQIIHAQNDDANFKVRELTHGTGANVSSANISFVDATNNIQYLGQTDANGVANISGMKPGTYQITAKKEGFIQFMKDNYTVDGNKQSTVSLIKKLNTLYTGRVDAFNVAFYQSVFPEIFGAGRRDPPHRERLLKIQNKIVNADQADSAILQTIRQNILSNTGYDLIEYVTNGDSLHTIYCKSNTNTSANGTDANGVIIAGWSKHTDHHSMNRFFHGLINQISMRPPGSIIRPTVMDPNVLTMIEPQVYDYFNIEITASQLLAVKRGEQNVFNMSHMQEFSPNTSTTGTSILIPTNGATNLPTSIEIKAAIDLQANKYRLQVAKDPLFTDFVFNGDVFRNDTTLTNLPAGIPLYIRENVSNDLGVSGWSPVVTVTTEIITSIEDNLPNQLLKVYPTICSSLLTIEIIPQKPAEYTIETISLTGVQLLRQSGETTIPLIIASNVSGFVPGLYFVKVTLKYTDCRVIKTFIIIKQ